MRPSKLKTTLAVLKKTLTKEVEMLASQKDRKTGELVKIPRKIKTLILTKEQIANWLECSVSKVEHIENGDLPLRPEDAKTIARRTGVKFRWLADNDVTQPIVNPYDEPYTVAEYEKHQVELQKLSFKSPLTNRDIWRVLEVMEDAFARVAAVVLRGVENGQLDVVEYKMRTALDKIYGDADSAMISLIVKSLYHGKPTITRPDPTALLDEWETSFKEIIARKTSGNLPVKYPKIKSLPAIRPPRKPRR